jgi:hypothetical protein
LAGVTQGSTSLKSGFEIVQGTDDGTGGEGPDIGPSAGLHIDNCHLWFVGENILKVVILSGKIGNYSDVVKIPESMH